jgi:serine/threonine-protein kinase
MGMIIGTAAYMAPEQAKGRAVDKRADIWAFGVVLYEMLTGQRAFKGDDISETLASVLKDTLAIDALPSGTPSRLRDLVARCLQKDPRQRQRDIGDVNPSSTRSPRAGATPRRSQARPDAHRPSLALVAAIVLVAAAIGVAIGWGLTRNSVALAGATTRFIVDSPPGPDPQGPLLTPDGRVLIFATDRLYRRDLGAFQATPMPGTEGGLMYNDPRLELKWPLPLSVISDKDQAWKLLSEVEPEVMPVQAHAALRGADNGSSFREPGPQDSPRSRWTTVRFAN